MSSSLTSGAFLLFDFLFVWDRFVAEKNVVSQKDNVAEWFRRQPAKLMGFARVGSIDFFCCVRVVIITHWSVFSFVLFGWCSWLSRQSNTLEVASSRVRSSPRIFLTSLLSLVAEHSLCKRKVVGSNPACGFFWLECSCMQKAHGAPPLLL